MWFTTAIPLSRHHTMQKPTEELLNYSLVRSWWGNDYVLTEKGSRWHGQGLFKPRRDSGEFQLITHAMHPPSISHMKKKPDKWWAFQQKVYNNFVLQLWRHKAAAAASYGRKVMCLRADQSTSPLPSPHHQNHDRCFDATRRGNLCKSNTFCTCLMQKNMR